MNRRGTQSSKWDILPHDPTLPWIALSVADMDLRCAPAVVDAIVQRASQGIYGYTDLPPDHTALVADRLARHHDWDVEPEHIVPAQRIVQVVALILQAHTVPGDGVLLFTPSYGPLERAILLNDRVPIRVPLELNDGHYRLDRAATEGAFRQVAVALLVNPHNPVGMVWTADDLEWLAARFEYHDILVMSDDVHADFIRAGHRHHFLAQRRGGISQRTFTFTSPAKSFNVPGLETTHVIVANPHLRETLQHRLAASGFHNPSFFSDAATRAAYEHSDNWFDEVVAITEENLHLLDQTCELVDGITLIEPQGTFLAWLDARGHGESRLREWWSKRAHVVPSYGTDFGPEYGGFLRVNLATESTMFAEAMRRIRHFQTHSIQ